MVMILIWFVFHYRSNSFFTYEGVSLGMSPEQVEEPLPAASKFKKINVIDQRSGNIIKFAMLESKEQPLPSKRLLIVSVEDEVVGISTYGTGLTGEQIEGLQSNMVSLYGVPDDNFESKFGSKTLVWGDVTFNMKDVMQGIVKIDGRAIIFRTRKPGTVNIYVTRDGKGPRIFF